MKKKFRCLVCGYVYEGENPPAECPQCHAKSDKFVEVKDEGKLVWACEHHLGDGKVEDAEIMQGLHDHFNGECTEVGMYLAMSRPRQSAVHARASSPSPPARSSSATTPSMTPYTRWPRTKPVTEPDSRAC